jgi:hypothetical protein
MANRVLNSSFIKTVVNSGRPVNVKYATETDAWKRYSLSKDMQDDFADAVAKTDLPAGATTAIMTYVTSWCTHD